MNRRSFLGGLIAAAGGLLLPEDPKRIYSFPKELKVLEGDVVIRGIEEATVFYRIHDEVIVDVRRAILVQATPLHIGFNISWDKSASKIWTL